MYRQGIAGSLLDMTLDVYVQEVIQDDNTGAIERSWVFVKTIPCHVDVSKRERVVNPENGKFFSFEYAESDMHKLKTSEKLSKRMRVSNIKNKYGEVIFSEDFLDPTPTIFEIDSSFPRLDPLGALMYYESGIRRVGVQSNA